jgi:hypothetical protein
MDMCSRDVCREREWLRGREASSREVCREREERVMTVTVEGLFGGEGGRGPTRERLESGFGVDVSVCCEKVKRGMRGWAKKERGGWDGGWCGCVSRRPVRREMVGDE